MFAPGLTAAVLAHAPEVVAATSSSKKGSPVLSYVLLAVVVLGLVFLLRRGRNAKAAAAQQQEQIVVGATVVTRAGLIATLVEQTEDEVVLEIAPGVRARFVPQAIGKVLPPDDPEEPGESSEHADGSADGDHDRLAD